MPDNNTNDVPAVFNQEVNSLKKLKKVWRIIKYSKAFKKFRASQLNPYHYQVKEVKADTLAKARKIVREKAKQARIANKKFRAQFLYKGTRYYADRYDCSPNQEYLEDGIVIRDGYDVTDRIPVNKKGELDLFAEEPIIIAINPIEGPELIGHVCIQYKDQVVNRLLTSVHTDPLYPKYHKYAQYFAIYPSQFNVDAEKVYQEMVNHNIAYRDKNYDLISNNCAQNVVKILKKAGFKGFDFYGADALKISYATPGNNPFGKGIKAWCHKNGIRITPKEMEEYHKRHEFSVVKEHHNSIRNIKNIKHKRER